MFRKTNIPILGMVQNMSLFTCPNCHNSTHIFGSHSGVTHACEEHGIDFLGDIPLHASICDDADRGKPTVVSEPESERAKAFTGIAEEVGTKVGLFEKS
jgi:ATP-binding protein involved in chromosome partitioning